VNNNTVSHKNVPINFGPYLCQKMTDFKNSFTCALCGKFEKNVIIEYPTTP